MKPCSTCGDRLLMASEKERGTCARCFVAGLPDKRYQQFRAILGAAMRNDKAAIKAAVNDALGSDE